MAYYGGVPGKPVREEGASKPSQAKGQLQGNSGGEVPPQSCPNPKQGAFTPHACQSFPEDSRRELKSGLCWPEGTAPKRAPTADPGK